LEFLPGRLSVIGLSIAAALTLALTGCDHGAAPKAARNPKVVVNSPVTEAVMDYQDFTGRLESIKSVDIRARVSGYITEAPFKEGDLVAEGKRLFQIDERPYQADLNQAEANLKVAVADYNLWEKNYVRAQQLLMTKANSREEFETVAATFEKSKAQVGAAEAARERAKLYLDYTHVIAPITGRISRRFVDPGNLILADNTILTSIVAENRMYAYFDVDERTYLDLLASSGGDAALERLRLPVMMMLANESDFNRVGVIDFIDNRVVGSTGTVRLRGVFDNPNSTLKPGLFVRIRLPIGEAYKSIIIPDEAVQNDQERKFVWVVNSKNEVEYRPVTIGQAIRDWRAIKPAEKGKEGKESLTEADRVIVSGIQRVRKGMAVDAETQTPTPPPEMPLVKLLNRPNVASK
jgi:RND family efflux transporter MFP subunit